MQQFAAEILFFANAFAYAVTNVQFDFLMGKTAEKTAIDVSSASFSSQSINKQ